MEPESDDGSSTQVDPAVVPSAVIELKQLVEEFQCCQKATKDIHQENVRVTTELGILQKRSVAHEHAQNVASEDAGQLHSTIEQLQEILSKRCDFEEENSSLKAQLLLMKEEANKLEQLHSQQIAEMMENMKAMQEANKVEISRLRDSSNQQLKKELETLQRTVQDKVAEIRQLRTQLSDADRDKHTEIVKLRLEYDAKLLKLQKQTTKSQTAQSSAVNSDIFRRKLQHAKAEAEREIGSLRKRVGDLERQLSVTNKRKKML